MNRAVDLRRTINREPYEDSGITRSKAEHVVLERERNYPPVTDGPVAVL